MGSPFAPLRNPRLSVGFFVSKALLLQFVILQQALSDPSAPLFYSVLHAYSKGFGFQITIKTKKLISMRLLIKTHRDQLISCLFSWFPVFLVVSFWLLLYYEEEREVSEIVRKSDGEMRLFNVGRCEDREAARSATMIISTTLPLD